jgi:hypothetical protein
MRVMTAVILAVIYVTFVSTNLWAADSFESLPIRVDTRSLRLTGLVISGPTSVPSSSEATYTATLYQDGAAPLDVSEECRWFVSGGPQDIHWVHTPIMRGRILEPRIPSTIPLRIVATTTRNSGRITSSPFSVIVEESNGLNVGIRLIHPTQTGPKYLRSAGEDYVWELAAEPWGLAASKPGVSFQWFIDNQPLANTKQVHEEITGRRGTKSLGLVVTDGNGNTGRVHKTIPFDIHLVSALDPGEGQLLDGDGEPFQFSPIKSPHGLIILSHGLYSSGDVDWLSDMARAIAQRLGDLNKPVPNIAIYDWRDRADPTTYLEYDEYYDKRISKARKIAIKALVVGNDYLPFHELIADALLVRKYGLAHGRELADWITSEISRGNILSSAPLHLIGHSAGGFVVGECGYRVGSFFDDIRVTTLDTPFPGFSHVWRYPNPDYLDRHISSVLGNLDLLATYGSKSETAFRKTRQIPDYSANVFSVKAQHQKAHEWYINTINSGAVGTVGFGWSPFMSTAVSKSEASYTSFTSSVPAEIEISVSNIVSIGSVSYTNGTYRLREIDDQLSGLVVSNYFPPAGTFTIRFSYQFTSAGDGDFLSVTAGDEVVFVGKDMPLTRDDAVLAHADVEMIGRGPYSLRFYLVPRGATNAVLSISNIVAVSIEDIDQDGLMNADEIALGTNPLAYDTDGDGISDFDEVNTVFSNPLVADSDGDGMSDGDEISSGTSPTNAFSLLQIESVSQSNGVVQIGWQSTSGSTYRVIASNEAGFQSYDVIERDILGAVPSQAFTNRVGTNAVGRTFYRILVEPTP